jgi:hypothetical protein
MSGEEIQDIARKMSTMNLMAAGAILSHLAAIQANETHHEAVARLEKHKEEQEAAIRTEAQKLIDEGKADRRSFYFFMIEDHMKNLKR